MLDEALLRPGRFDETVGEEEETRAADPPTGRAADAGQDEQRRNLHAVLARVRHRGTAPLTSLLILFAPVPCSLLRPSFRLGHWDLRAQAGSGCDAAADALRRA